MDMAMIEQAYIKQLKKSPFSGVVSVSKGEDILFERAAGYANIAEAIPMHSGTRFGAASGAKSLTAIAVCRLIEQGKARFDTPIAETARRNLPYGPEVTLERLLSHTSGIGDYCDEEEGEDYEEVWKERPCYAFRKPADFLPLFVDRPAKFAPGSRFSYNNAAYILLALAVEGLSGKAFPEAMDELVLKPAGMTESGYFALDALPANCATGYIDEDDGSIRSNIYSIPAVGGGDGGVFLSAGDARRFWKAFLGGDLVAEPLADKLLSPLIQTNEGKPGETFYGMGFWVAMREGLVRCAYMLGEDPGAAFVSAYYPSTGIVFTMLGNRAGSFWGMFDALKEIVAS
jgi:CubicO group peptidase (beta-lactamase class C family)